ncbi:hypothetical protein FD14_GL002530 [Secundilactobacillus similis DSM 23365 = JCM 2765]|uniref:DUF3644 domain-containing protein n=1 Tax=Secundilactobacillus similis DSM 23365 = JCM 2765 TaxID=1423804 RepID=A0A0R2ENK0_9LACO|nr:hypothetical protein FD14_GL002530 [Secundilactobacillus similis DSM 23365 = JCM 2765]
MNLLEDLSKRLVNKSVEAFIMGIEIFNKPTIKYRIEGFSFFICNAWELMLKAYLINSKGEQSIYFKNHPDRTISLEETIKKIFTNDKDPLRINLEKIVELRNTSTHFVTEDYESIYAPLFQACVINYANKINELHNIDVTNFIANNFLSLNLRVDKLSDVEIRAKYTPEVAERLIMQRNKIAGEVEEQNESFAIPVKTTFFITKNEKDADLKVQIDNKADPKIQIVKEIKDPNSTHPLTNARVIALVNKRLKKDKILITKKYKDGSQTVKFTTNDFQLFNKFYNIKSKPKYTYHITIGNRYSYSTKVVDFIIEEIKKDPEHIIQNLKTGINIKK